VQNLVLKGEANDTKMLLTSVSTDQYALFAHSKPLNNNTLSVKPGPGDEVIEVNCYSTWNYYFTFHTCLNIYIGFRVCAKVNGQQIKYSRFQACRIAPLLAQL
jgi:hypothetical protein